jgi:hypothetical protein
LIALIFHQSTDIHHSYYLELKLWKLIPNERSYSIKSKWWDSCKFQNGRRFKSGLVYYLFFKVGEPLYISWIVS